jgi:integrase
VLERDFAGVFVNLDEVGLVPEIRMGRALRYRKSAIDAALARHTHHTSNGCSSGIAGAMTYNLTSALQTATHTYRPLSKPPRSPSVVVVGEGRNQARIYTIKRKDGCASYQCVWYELGKRQSKSFACLEAAKFFAHQKVDALACGRVPHNEVRFRDIEMLRDCEARARQQGVSLVVAIEEWSAARQLLGKHSLIEAMRIFIDRHANITGISFADAADKFVSNKTAACMSSEYLRSLRHYFRGLKAHFGSRSLDSITVQQIEAVQRASQLSAISKNNTRRVLVTLFRWAQHQGYLQPDRKTAPERTMTFSIPDAAPTIFTTEEMEQIIAAAPEKLVPHLVLGAFAGIRSAEIGRLEWPEIMWEQSFIEIKARKAKTKARRLVPLLPNLRAWLEPYRRKFGFVCHLPNTPCRLSCLGEKAGCGWRQNALRHSYASYRLAAVQDAPRVALEMGNSPEKLFRHYRELVTPAAAKRWFNIFPNK